MSTSQALTKQTTAREVAGLVQKAVQLLSSAQGQSALKETVRRTVETADRLRSAQRVDPKALQEPITV